MRRHRLEAFSDGVLAIIITIMVLQLEVPKGDGFATLRPLLPLLLSYILSFAYIGIYWNNHHHLLHTVERTSAGVLWANLHFLFWLSLLPFATGWMGENHFAQLPTAVYGCVLLMAAGAYWILEQVIIRSERTGEALERAVGTHDTKGLISLAVYVAAIGSTLIDHRIAQGLYIVVAIMWLIPDRRIEREIDD